MGARRGLERRVVGKAKDRGLFAGAVTRRDTSPTLVGHQRRSKEWKERKWQNVEGYGSLGR